VPPEPSLRSLVLPQGVDAAALLVCLALGSAYVVGVRRLAARGRRWAPARSLSFASGIGVLVVATQSGLAAYDDVLFAAHSAQHVLLGMVAPTLLALGAPVTLALQASSRPLQQVLLTVLHSRPARVVAHPVVVWVLFGGTLVALYASPLLELSLRHGVVHTAVHLHVVGTGALFCWTAIGVDPNPRRLPHGARVGFVFLAVPVHAILGVTLLGTTSLLAGGHYAAEAPPWLDDVLADQRLGAGILWVTGELFGLALTGIALARWMGAEERTGRRHDTRGDAVLGPP
jgi:putative copper resistance protein D